MTIFVYVLAEVVAASKEQTIEALGASGLVCEERNVCIDHEKCTLPAAERPVLQRTVRRLWPGDTLVTTHLCSLGNSIIDVLSTLRSVECAGATVVCLSLGRETTAPLDGQLLTQSLELVAELDHVMRQKRARQASDEAANRGLHVGRPSSLSCAQQEAALRALSSGQTVTAIARQFQTSRQTIMRLLANKPRNRGH